MKPNLIPADLEVLKLYKSLPWGTRVFLGDKPAITSGIIGNDPVLKIKGRNKYFRLGDPILRTLRV